MNKVVLVGRLVKDPEIKNTASQVPFCNFTVAVDRRFKDNNGQRQADFINCVAWRQTASFIGQYFKKGSKIGLIGSIQTRTFDDQNGQRRYVTEVVVDEVEFVESANAAAGRTAQPAAQAPYSAPVQGTSAATAPAAPVAPSAPIAPSMGGSDLDGDAMDLPFDMF